MTEHVRILEDRLAAWTAIGSALSKSVGLDALFRSMVPNISRLLRAERTTLFLYDAGRQEIWSKVAEGEGVREIRLALGSGIAGWVAAHKQPLNIEDAYKDARFNPEVDARTGFRTQSVLTVPVLDPHGALMGVLQVLNHASGRFSATDEELLVAIATQAAYAIDNAHLAEELLVKNRALELAQRKAEQRSAELDLLYKLEKEVSAANDEDALITSVLTQAAQSLDASSALVTLADGRTIRHERASHDASTTLSVPLSFEGQSLGTLAVSAPPPREDGTGGFSHEDVKVLSLVATQLARAVATIRERKAKEGTERLALIGRMLAGVAHDLRNPMTVISGFAEITAVEDDAEQRKSHCRRMMHQVDEMSGMIMDLLAFARGDSRLRLSRVEAAMLAKEIEETFAMPCKHRGIRLQVVSGGGALEADLGRLKRIVYNLVKNALDVLSTEGQIDVALAVQNDELALSVKDNGPGIPMDLTARLFEPFVSGGKSGGTGLGLSIVKRFVDDHSGKIEVDSAPGRGTRFVVQIPSTKREETRT